MDIYRQIIDQHGNIRNFPGIDYEQQLVEEYGEREIKPVVRFGARFIECADDYYMMVWTVRPDGRYWMDSMGFGAEDYESLCLYSYVDKNGTFVQPFKLYSIGRTYFGEHAPGEGVEGD